MLTDAEQAEIEATVALMTREEAQRAIARLRELVQSETSESADMTGVG